MDFHHLGSLQPIDSSKSVYLELAARLLACFLRYLPVALTRAQLNVQAPALPACLHRHWRGDARRSWRKSQCHQIMHGMKEIRHTQALQAFFRKVDQGIGPGH